MVDHLNWIFGLDSIDENSTSIFPLRTSTRCFWRLAAPLSSLISLGELSMVSMCASKSDQSIGCYLVEREERKATTWNVNCLVVLLVVGLVDIYLRTPSIDWTMRTISGPKWKNVTSFGLEGIFPSNVHGSLVKPTLINGEISLLIKTERSVQAIFSKLDIELNVRWAKESMSSTAPRRTQKKQFPWLCSRGRSTERLPYWIWNSGETSPGIEWNVRLIESFARLCSTWHLRLLENDRFFVIGVKIRLDLGISLSLQCQWNIGILQGSFSRQLWEMNLHKVWAMLLDESFHLRILRNVRHNWTRPRLRHQIPHYSI